MALLLEQTLHNGDVVRYHHFAEFKINGRIYTGVLYSFRDRKHREFPVPPLTKREFVFEVNAGDDHFQCAYAAVKAQPEWALAVDA